MKNSKQPSQEPEKLKTAASSEEETVSLFIREPQMAILFDLAVLINAIYQQHIEPTQARNISKRVVNKLRPLLAGSPRINYEFEDIYLDLLVNMARDLHLIQLTASPLPDVKPHYTPGKNLDRWTKMNSVEQTASLLHTWAKTSHWSEAYGADFEYWEPYGWNPLPGRLLLLEYLSECIPDEWHTVESLLDKIWENHPFELHLYQKQQKKKKSPELKKLWRNCDGEAYIGMLSTTLPEMGLLRLGVISTETPEGMQDSLIAFQLTDFGTEVLHNLLDVDANPATETQKTEGIAQTLIIQPNFELLLLEPDITTLYSILPFTQIHTISTASRLALTRNSLLHSMEHGKTLKEILAILEKHSAKELPQNVVYTLKDWAKSYKKVSIGQVYLLECANEELADELICSPKLNKRLQDFHLRKVGPCTLAINCTISLSAFINKLEKEGISVGLNEHTQDVTLAPGFNYNDTY
jgi:hypothetical protein